MADYRVDHNDGTDWVVDVVVHDDVGAAADQLLREVPRGRVVTRDEDLVAALVERGARVRRRAHDYEHDLTAVPPAPPLPAGVTLRPVRDDDAAGIAEAHALAYPPGHPDHRPDEDALKLATDMLAGRVLGPLVAEASRVAEADGRVVGAVLVADRPEFANVPARAWVLDVNLRPEWQGRGVGRALLHAAIAGSREAGLPMLGLAVTDGNPAIRAYEAAGFRLVYSGASVDLPG